PRTLGKQVLLISAVGCVLVAGVSGVVALLASVVCFFWLLAPVIGRGAMLGLFLGTPYVRAGGLGQALADHLPRTLGKQVLLISAVGCVLVAGVSGVVALLASVVCFFWLRQLMIRRLGGSTGDTAGAMVELLEMAVLVVLVLV
ncbi:adenosylcobinamide-GDP ribazoletransferase, partial [Pseudomonas sp.]|uniref:adenosylcobinamide-GDP ribazoletransferase n=1 Tax=Pseudomonas sp. TaxID=306 RepID=UPI002628E8A5